MPEKDSGIVYHYCSLEAFKSIIENKCLWLCDVQKSNDSTERLYLERIMLQLIDKYIDSISVQNPCPYPFLSALNAYKNFYPELSARCAPIYSCSFSHDGDQLSQWRGYADNGFGISIGVSTYFFEKTVLANSFNKVYYGQSNAEKACESYINDSLFFAQHNATNNSFDTVFVNSLWEAMEFNSTFFKSSAFSEESESRIALKTGTCYVSTDSFATYYHMHSHPLSHYSDFSDWTLSQKKYRINHHSLSSYYELSFSKIRRDFLREIILGPKCCVTAADLRMFLADCGYETANIIISPSKVTYR